MRNALFVLAAIQLVMRVIGNEELFQSKAASDEQRKQLKDMIDKLRAFESIATGVANVLEERLAQTSTPSVPQAKPILRPQSRRPQSSKARTHGKKL